MDNSKRDLGEPKGPVAQVEIDPVHPEAGLAERAILLEQIGEGGMGQIHVCFDKNLLTRRIRKTLKIKHTENARALCRFIQEAQVTAQLDHPNIVPVHEIGVDNEGRLFFTMTYIQGRDLSEIIRTTDFANRSKAELFAHLQIFLKVCDALAFAHSRGAIHSDLKPENIKVSDFGEVYVLDWGIASLKDPSHRSSLARAHVAGDRRRYCSAEDGGAGSPGYMSPEQVLGMSEVDERSDVFSLGAILYELLTQQPPISGDSMNELLVNTYKGVVREPTEVVDFDIPPSLSLIAMRALKRDPRLRYQSVRALQQEVENFLQGSWQFDNQTFPAGGLIVAEGDPADRAFIITGGRCEVFKTVGGKRVVLREMGRGDVFGETALFAGASRTASVVATSEVTCLVVDKEQFDRDLGMDYWLGLFMQTLAERFKEKDARVTQLKRSLEESDLTNAVLIHLLVAGQDGADGLREADWSELKASLMDRFELSESAVESAVSELGGFTIEGDMVRLG